MSQYFGIDSSEDQRFTSQYENLRISFRSFSQEMESISGSLKRRTFEQRKYFDYYDCIISPISYLSYTNDERAFYEETYQSLFTW